MSCSDIQADLSLYLYGELDFAREEYVEAHLDSCAACQLALSREKEWHAALNRQPADVRPEFLAACRNELNQKLKGMRAGPAAVRFGAREWLKNAKGAAARRQGRKELPSPLGGAPDTATVLRAFLKNVFDFRITHQSYRLAAISFLVLGGFAAGRAVSVLPGGVWSSAGGVSSAGLMSGPITRVEAIQPQAGNRVRIVLQQVQVREISGNRDDDGVRAILVEAAREASDPGVRLDSVEMLAGQPGIEIRNALATTIETDPNAAVRVKAIQSISQFPSDPVTRGALEFALAHDRDPGVRAIAIDALMPAQGDFQITPQLLQILSEVMQQDAGIDDYVRLRCAQILNEHPSVDSNR